MCANSTSYAAAKHGPSHSYSYLCLIALFSRRRNVPTLNLAEKDTKEKERAMAEVKAATKHIPIV